MRFFFVASLFAGAAMAADANSVKANIAALQNYTIALNGDSNNYPGGTGGIGFALQVQQDAVVIYNQAKIAIADVNAAAAFSSADSSSVYTATNNLGTNVKTALTTIQGKATTFGDLKPLVLSSLYQLRISTNNYATGIIAKLASADKTNGNNVKTSVDNAFKAAITAYGGTAS